jgi:hypothetical protein
MDPTRWLQWLREAVDDLRAEYEAHGLGEEFEQQVEQFRAAGRWPLDD